MHNLLYYTNCEAAQDFERQYGPYLEQLSVSQRIALLHYLVVQLNLGTPSLAPQEWPTLHALIEQLEGTPPGDLFRMVEAIASWEASRPQGESEAIAWAAREAALEEGAIAS